MSGVDHTDGANQGIDLVVAERVRGSAVDRPVVLVFTRCYLPGFKAGGPIRSIANLVEQLGDEFEFRIVTSDRDQGDSKKYPNVINDEWVACGNAMVMYVDVSQLGRKGIADIISSICHDVIYLNSFFDSWFTRRVLLNRLSRRHKYNPIILAPRGEFSPGALDIKRLRKRIGMRVADWIGLYDGLTWQASTVYEADEMRRALPRGWHEKHGGSIIIAADVPRIIDNKNVSDADDNLPAAGGNGVSVLHVCFLSRISPKKNLDFALRALKRVHAKVQFTIYGPREADYWKQCKAIIDELPINVQVHYAGEIAHDQVARELALHDLFFLPTRGENYGHVMAEALSAGLPLLISDQTPWRNLTASRVGWDLPLDNEDAFVKSIEEVACWTGEERACARKRARLFASHPIQGSDIVEANRRLFTTVVRKKWALDSGRA